MTFEPSQCLVVIMVTVFLHNMIIQIAGEMEVRGQIKLKFRDVTGNPMVVTRTLVSEQKVKNFELICVMLT